MESNTLERWHADCMDCGEPTFECMGLVLASDFNVYNGAMEKGQQLGHIRVRCGRCVERMLFETEKRCVA